MAGLAETHEVVPCVSAAFGNGQDVVNFLYRSQPTFPETHLTEGVLRRIAVTDAFPCSAVLAIDIGTTLVFVVFAAFLREVLLTELSFTEVGAAGMRAGSQRFLRHRFTSLGIRKAPRDCSHEAVLYSFAIIMILHLGRELYGTIVYTFCFQNIGHHIQGAVVQFLYPFPAVVHIHSNLLPGVETQIYDLVATKDL